jgi:uncharacterized membrane protein YagU involved in acid resistance
MIGERGDLGWWEPTERGERAWRGEESSPLRGLCAGLAAGLLATLVMDGFSKLVETTSEAIGNGSQEEKRDGDEPATAKLGRRISRSVIRRDLDHDSAQLASEAVHYGYGTLMGGLYGLLGEIFPTVTVASGAPWGAALFLLGDEVMVPALGLAKGPREVPVSTHARALGAHLLYGTTLDLLRRGILACMAQRDARRGEQDVAPASSLVWIDSTELETGAF